MFAKKSPEQQSRSSFFSSVLLTVKIFASCENFLTEGNEGNKDKETQRLAFLRCLCSLLFNKLVAAKGRAGLDPWLIQVNDRIAVVIPGARFFSVSAVRRLTDAVI